MDHIMLSLRNLLRNYKRTVLTLSVLVLGIVAMLIYAGYIDFSMWGYREQTIQGGLGHIRVYQAGYNSRENESYMSYLVKDSRDVYRMLMKTPHVLEVTSELNIQGLLSNGETSELTMARGYDLSSVSVIQGSYTVTEGEFPDGSDEYKIALGKGLADKLNAKVGTYLTFMTTTADGALNAVDYEVSCIMKTGIKEYDERLSVVSIGSAQSLLDVSGVESFILMLDKTDAVNEVISLIKNSAAENSLRIECRSWSDLAQFYHKVKAMNDTYYTITQLIILVIVAFSIVNTMRMVIYERMREIGTVRAIGMNRNQVVLMFLYEGIWLGLIAIILGLAGASFIGSLINISGGIYISPPPGQNEGYHSMIRPDFIRYIQVSAIIMISVVSGSLLPAIRGAQVKIDSALRYV